MEQRQKSGIAIVDEHVIFLHLSLLLRFPVLFKINCDRNGNLVGATTAKDLSLFIKNPTLQALQGNIFDYLKLIRQEQINVCSLQINDFLFLLLFDSYSL